MTTESLFSKLQKEKSTGELNVLSKDFYEQISAFIKTLSKGASEENHKQAENAKKLIIALKERRRQKILTYLAYGKPLPQQVPAEEEVLYNEIRQILNRNSSTERTFRIKVITTIPEVLTTEGRRIGPFKQGELIEITNSGDAEFIIKNKIGEPIG